jgi:hypothetical protein
MLRFFRKMRSALIPENRFGRYFFYALGEIALVVIGILIALQVNTWNESRKAGIKERMLLYEMMKNLESNVTKLENMLEGFKRDNFSSTVIISALENKIEYNDTLDVHFALALNQSSEGSLLSFVSYESLKSSGFDIIRNDQLRNEIISLFELTYGNLQNRNDRVGQTFPLVSKLKHEHLMRRPGFKFTPYDFKSLAEDKIFLSWLYSIKDNRSWIAQNIEISLQETQRVLQLVKYELNEN